MASRRSTSGAGLADVRAINRAVVLELVRSHGPLSRADVAKLSGLAKPTASGIMEELVRDAIVFELGIGPVGRAGGRRPVLYQFNPRSWFLVGIAIDNEHTTLAVSDAIGFEIGRAKIRTRKRAPVAMRVIGEAAIQLLADHHIAPTQVAASSVSIVGPVDPATGVCTLAPNLGWRDIDVPALLQPYLVVRPTVHNVADAVLFAEHLEGAAKDVDDAVLLHEIKGVGGAILIGGQLHAGALGLAGEVGHSKVAGATHQCGCGGIGCLETEISRMALVRRAATIRPDLASLPAVLASSAPGVRAILEDVGRQLGRTAAWMVSVVSPQVVVVAGGFVDYGPRVLEFAERAFRADLLPQFGPVELRLAVLADAPVRGAVLLAQRRVDERMTGWSRQDAVPARPSSL